MIAGAPARGSLTALMAACVLFAGMARAGADEERATGDDPGDASYYFDAGALTIYGAGLGYLATALFMEPPDTPRFFSASEGGAEYRGSTVPDWTLGVFAGVTAATIVAAPDQRGGQARGHARWYHTKGFLGSLATTAFLTEMAKNVYGRHRPDYQPGDPVAGSDDGRKSFFSGHSSITLASTTYLALYLHDHVFPGLRRDPDSVPWWEVASYTGLVALSVYVPFSRVHDNRHNPSDVLVGSAVGLTAAIGFYRWQETRLRCARSLDGAVRQETQTTKSARLSNLVLIPTAEPLGLSMAGRF
jgi:membrane-associated phospholipid phosphatase